MISSSIVLLFSLAVGPLFLLSIALAWLLWRSQEALAKARLDMIRYVGDLSMAAPQSTTLQAGDMQAPASEQLSEEELEIKRRQALWDSVLDRGSFASAEEQKSLGVS